MKSHIILEQISFINLKIDKGSRGQGILIPKKLVEHNYQLIRGELYSFKLFKQNIFASPINLGQLDFELLGTFVDGELKYYKKRGYQFRINRIVDPNSFYSINIYFN